MAFPTLNTVTSDSILVAVVNSFDDVSELSAWASSNNLPNDPVVLARLDVLRGQTTSRNCDVPRASTSTSFPCTSCDQLFSSNGTLNKHRRRMHRVDSLVCAKCNVTFRYQKGYEKHIGKCTGLQCCLCGKTFDSNTEMLAHKQLHLSGQLPTEYHCFDCNQVFATLIELYTHRNVLHGGALLDEEGLQPTPFGENPPWSLPGELPDLALRDIYNVNRRHILRPHRDNKHSSIYNYPTNNIDGGMNELTRILNDVYRRQDKLFKVNVSLGVILRKISEQNDGDDGDDTPVYRYFIPYKNTNLFDRPMIVGDRRDVEKVINKLRSLDIDSYSKTQRPDTSWKPYLVTNINVIVFKTSYVLGASGTLPQYIRNKKSIIAMETDRGIPYNDNLCIFRCLVYHRTRCIDKGNVLSAFRDWVDFKESDISQDTASFAGVDIADFHKFEDCFETALAVYSLYEDGSVRRVYESGKDYSDVMVLNLYHKHLSYVTDFGVYAKKFSCSMCGRNFKRVNNLSRHVRRCVEGVKLKFTAGVHKGQPTIFEELECYGIHVDNKDRFYDWFLVFDFEAYLVHTEEAQSGKLIWEQEHKPVSVSIASNVPGFESPVCIVEEESCALMKKTVEYMNEVSSAAKLLARKKFKHVIKAIADEHLNWQWLYVRSDKCHAMHNSAKNDLPYLDETAAAPLPHSDELFQSTNLSAEVTQPDSISAEESQSLSHLDSPLPSCSTDYVDKRKMGKCIDVKSESVAARYFLDDCAPVDGDNGEDVPSGSTDNVGKRKKGKCIDVKSESAAARYFLDDCASVDGDDGEDGDEVDTYDITDDFIDDSDIIDTSIDDYRSQNNVFDDACIVPSSHKDSGEDKISPANKNPFFIMTKKLKELFQKFSMYCDQLPALAFNSAKYDLNLVKSQFMHELCLSDDYDEKDVTVIKNRNAYLLITCPQFRFLDVARYMAAGCSYARFLKAFGVTEKKSFFPYDWFTSPHKLDDTNLPPYDAFYSKLKRMNVLEEELTRWDGTGDRPKSGRENYAELCSIWERNEMNSMRDFLVYYNNLDTAPFVTAAQKLLAFYRDMDVDLFKAALSVAGVARVLMFARTEKAKIYFTVFGSKDEDLFHTFKQNIVGGPSIVFHRHHKVGETNIRGGKKCKAIVGFDSNALYPYCLSQLLPCFIYVRRGVSDAFLPHIPVKNLDMYYWMEYLNESYNLNIKHRLNYGKEKVIGPFFVDGYDSITNTVYEYTGCFWHGHVVGEPNCTKTKLTEKYVNILRNRYFRTLDRSQFIEDQGYNYTQIWECEFAALMSSEPKVLEAISKLLPSFYRQHQGTLTSQTILESILDGSLYGMCEVDIHVPPSWEDVLTEKNKRRHSFSPYDYFAEMSPLFCTVNIPFSEIGEHMQSFVNEQGLSRQSRKALVGGMSATKILLATPLLKWYLEHGMVVTYIYQIVEFTPMKCFKDFQSELTEARREGDRNPDKKIMGETMKLLSNSCYGGLLLDRTKHSRIKFVRSTESVISSMNEPRFINMTDLGNDLFEVENAPKSVNMSLAIQIPFTVLQYAKLHLLAFIYDYVDTYISRADYQLIEIDTDSAYMALSRDTFADAVRDEMKDEYFRTVAHSCSDRIEYEPDYQNVWVPRICCDKHAIVDSRTPGIFKKEAEGSEMVALASKCYILQSDSNSKLSCKGINKSVVTDPLDTFRSVLDSQKPVSAVNRGFRHHKNTVFTYKQHKQAFSYFYCKRQLLEDGVTTIPLKMTLTPGHTDVITFNRWHILSPFYIKIFSFKSLSFSSLQQCLMYSKVVYHKRRDLIINVLTAYNHFQLEAVDKMFKTNCKWRLVWDKYLVDMGMAKALQVEEVNKFLVESKAHSLIFADEYDSLLGCGLSEKLAHLRPQISHPGNNIMGSVWGRVRHKLLSN